MQRRKLLVILLIFVLTLVIVFAVVRLTSQQEVTDTGQETTGDEEVFLRPEQINTDLSGQEDLPVTD